MIGRRAFLAGLGTSIVSSPALAFPHGWDPTNPFGQWVQGLKRPDTNPPSSCCGKGDLYSIVIDEDAIGDDDTEGHKQWGSAHVLDGSAHQFPDGTQRPAIRDGYPFRFPKKIVNPPKDGNPGPTAWAFFGVYVSEDGKVEHNVMSGLYCVIPLPGAV